MDELVLATATRQQVSDYMQRPAQSLLISGATGSGKSYVARTIAAQLLDVQPVKLDDYPYIRFVTGESSIGIEQVRDLQQFLSLSVPRSAMFTRAVIIERAHLMTPEAQNALLKTLEEPPKATLIILLTDRALSLLPTIRSRAQHIRLRRPVPHELQRHFMQTGHPEAEVKSAYAMSAGLPGLMAALLSDGQHPLKQATETARSILQASVFERLCMTDTLSKQKALLTDTIAILQHMADIRLRTSQDKESLRWQQILQASYDAKQALQTNAQTKLIVTRLMLAL